VLGLGIHNLQWRLSLQENHFQQDSHHKYLGLLRLGTFQLHTGHIQWSQCRAQQNRQDKQHKNYLSSMLGICQ
jgi:hypothetical protein